MSALARAGWWRLGWFASPLTTTAPLDREAAIAAFGRQVMILERPVDVAALVSRTP